MRYRLRAVDAVGRERFAGTEFAANLVQAIRQCVSRVPGGHLDLPFNPTNLVRLIPRVPKRFEYLGVVVTVEEEGP